MDDLYSCVRREFLVIKEICSCVRGFEDLKDLQLSAQIRTVVFVESWIKHSSMDITPTLGVNHVIFGVVFCYVLSCINIYISDK